MFSALVAGGLVLFVFLMVAYLRKDVTRSFGWFALGAFLFLFLILAGCHYMGEKLGQTLQ